MLKLLEHINAVIKSNLAASFEDCCVILAKKTGLPLDEVMDLADGLITCDASDSSDSDSALPIAYVITVTNAEEQVMQAQFEEGSGKAKKLVGYKKLSKPVHERVLRQWA